MDEMKTLKELCRESGVSRRAVQGFEKAGIVSATRRNKYGHLLYDRETQNKIERIKFLQQLGFSVKEISDFIEDPRDIQADKLKLKIESMKQEIVFKEELVRKAQEMLYQLNQK